MRAFLRIRFSKVPHTETMACIQGLRNLSTSGTDHHSTGNCSGTAFLQQHYFRGFWGLHLKIHMSWCSWTQAHRTASYHLNTKWKQGTQRQSKQSTPPPNCEMDIFGPDKSCISRISPLLTHREWCKVAPQRNKAANYRSGWGPGRQKGTTACTMPNK
jgi:hypothetical protein